jgi:lysophospholipase L1-like esterase
VAADLLTADRDTTFSLLATDGATTRTLCDTQLPKLAALRGRPTLVTVTIGGNDLLGAYGDTEAGRDVIVRVQSALARALPEIPASSPRLAGSSSAPSMTPATARATPSGWGYRPGRRAWR